MSNRNEYNERDEMEAFEQAVKDFMSASAAAGKPVTEEKAREKVLALMELD